MTEATVYRGALRRYRHPNDMLIISVRRRRTVAELADAMLDAPSGADNELAAELIDAAGGIDSARTALARARARREGHPVIYDVAADDLRPTVPLSVQLALSVVNQHVQDPATMPRALALEAMAVVGAWLRGEHCDSDPTPPHGMERP